MKTRIWFNRTFSTAFHFIDMIRNNPDGHEFEFFATHPKKHSIVLQAADYAEIEPSLDVEDYIQYCLDFCKKHKIDVFVPNLHLVEIAKHVNRFEEIGTKVLVSSDYDLLQRISNKGTLFDSLRSVQGVELPEYRIVNDSGSFLRSVIELQEKGYKVCFKPANGEGGVGFRVIEKKKNTIGSLLGPLSNRISLEEAYQILSVERSFDDVMVMEYLDGFEYSIDCLAFNGKLLAAVPRKKVEGRIRLLEENDELITLAHVIHNKLQLPYNFNIQIIYKNGIPKLLEINPRTSGGLFVSCLTGINFPYLAVKLLLSGEADVPAPNYNILATHFEKELRLVRAF
ncbi:ATP-grasp domain-containing protein [Brevibacillus sp. SYSU BS000544]|uniref:ATP-grasp domain-containing protein n=1 Tax=Brevibacillus sp. SYSU BS000544 TaxID=3416443 RepID=UPI003CE4B12C